jgi:hypothetical protein
VKPTGKARAGYQAVRVYVEGGGTSRGEQATLRESFTKLLGAVVGDLSKPKLIAAGGRGNTFDEFRAALRMHPDALCILLVDSEGPVKQRANPWSHVRDRRGDQWKRPDTTTDEQLHLMVETMETWIVADSDALVQQYGPKVDLDALPSTNLETISKQDVLQKIARALRNTGKQYTKSAGWVLIGRVNPSRVEAACSHACRFFDHLRRTCAALPRSRGVRGPGT